MKKFSIETLQLKKYFEDAEEEVFNSNNQSLASMYIIAIETMARTIEDNEKESTPDELYSRIYELESENRKLKTKLESIESILNQAEK